MAATRSSEEDSASAHVVERVISRLGFGCYQVRIIVILGFVQATDTMETLIQAILGPSLRCSWRLGSDYVALLATMVFLGVCFGAAPMGYLSDLVGRRPTSLLSCLGLVYFTLLCAMAPTYGWIAFLRLVSGLFISGLLTSSTSLMAEFMPDKHQTTGQLLIYAFDTLVAIYVAGVGLACLRADLTWRHFLVFSTFPLLLSLAGLKYLTHESPVLLASWGQTDRAAHALDAIARANGRTPVTADGRTFSFVGRLAHTEERQGVEASMAGVRRILAIFTALHKLTMPLLVLINFAWGFLIYGGTTLLPVELPTRPRVCMQDPWNANKSRPLMESHGAGNGDCCLPLGEEGYKSLFASVIGSILSFPVALTLIWLVGRKWTICACFLSTCALLFAQAFCVRDMILFAMFFATRAVASAGFNATNIFLTDCFAPHIRSLAFGITATAYRLGVLAAPYVGQVYLHKFSDLGALMIFSAAALAGFLVSLNLPHVTCARAGKPVSHGDRDHEASDRKTLWNIFKRRKPLTAMEATVIASGHIFHAEEALSNPSIL